MPAPVLRDEPAGLALGPFVMGRGGPTPPFTGNFVLSGASSVMGWHMWRMVAASRVSGVRPGSVADCPPDHALRGS